MSCRRTEEELPGVLVGRELATLLRVRVGDSVTLTTPQGTLSPMGMIPRVRRVHVAGIYSLGLYEFDSAYGYVSLDFAQRLMGKDSVDLIQAKVDDIYAAPQVAERIPQLLGAGYVAQDWTDMNAQLFSALWLEKMAMSIAIGLIVSVAALNIIASLILLVMEKSRDIAILKTMGTSSPRIMRIFMLQGLIIGVDRHDDRSRARARALLGARHLSPDPDPDGRLQRLLHSVRRRAARPCRRHRVCGADLVPRDDLSVTPGIAARPGPGSQVRMRPTPSSIRVPASSAQPVGSCGVGSWELS